MQVEIDGKWKEVKKLKITIDGADYQLTESIDKKLTVNKNHYDGDAIMVFPRVSNEIDIK